MKKMTNQEFKEDTLEMLKAFATFCEDNNLRYLLDYGTLLGSVRHKGFIPWDDDIDVSMPKEDYTKLYELLKEKDFSFNNSYKLASFDNKYNINKVYFNIIDIKTITESAYRKEKYYYPVWLDIFPCDKIDINNFDDSKIKKYVRYAQYPIFSQKNLLKRLIKDLFKPFMKLYFNKAVKLSQVNNNSNITELHNYYSPYGLKDIMHQKYFDNYIYGEFEGYKFRIPKDYDERLKNIYGNYMKLPPKDKRIGHVNNAFYLDE